MLSPEEALDLYMEPEKLEGYTCDTGVEVQASKYASLEVLPRVLIIHLKVSLFNLNTYFVVFYRLLMRCNRDSRMIPPVKREN